MNISIDKYWDNTLQLCKCTLDMLTTFEGSNYALIDKTIEPLRNLIQQGSDLEFLKNYQQQQQQQQQQQTSSASSSSSSSSSSASKGKQLPVPRSNGNNVNQLQQEQEHLYQNQNWNMINEKTIHISTEGADTVIVAKAVTTSEELEELVAKIKSTRTAALDCEFIALKNAPPQLQLLQVAVSATEGYAIVIDKVGIDALNEKLKPILEDSEINFVGWAFRGDALAIESTIKGVKLTPVLDLQAMLRPVAVEEMNLYSAVTKYAPDWDALKEFQNAKLLGDGFNYHEGDCIWLKDPLPPAALVYSVFDVVSLMALLNSTKQYSTTEDHYWPCTIINTAGRKSLRNWHKQRALGFSAPIIDTKNLKNQGAGLPAASSYNNNNESSSSGKRGYKNQRNNFNFVQNNNDREAQYEEDLQKALFLSLKETTNTQNHNYTSSSKEDRVIDSETINIQYSGLYPSGSNDTLYFAPPPQEEEETEDKFLECTWGDIVNQKQKPFFGLDLESGVNMDYTDVKPPVSPLPSSISQQSSVQPNGTTIQIMKRPTTVITATTTTTPSSAASASVTAIEDKEQEEPFESLKLYSKDIEPPSPMTSTNSATTPDIQEMFSFKPEITRPQDKKFDRKPDMSNYAVHLNTKGGVADQSGVFSWNDECSGGGEAWKLFAQTASSGWKKNEDTDLSAIDTIKPVSTPAKHEDIRFNTLSNNTWQNKNVVLPSTYNEWDVMEERPTLMRMPITKFESSRKFTGPKCVNPTDTSYTDESDDDDDDNIVSGWSNDNFNKKNSEDSKNDDVKEDNSVTSPSGSENHFKNEESSQTNRLSRSSKSSSLNDYSRPSPHERNNNSRQYRFSNGHNHDRSSYQGNSYNNNNNNSYNYNNSNYKNYNNKYKNNYNNNNNNNNNNNYYYNNNYNDNGNYNNNIYQNNSNNNNKWQNCNSTSSISSSHSTPQPNQSRQAVNTITATTVTATETVSSTDIYELEIYVNEFYISTGEYIKLFKITQPSHLDMIILPPLEEKFTVAITYHLAPSTNKINGVMLKAIQFYLANNESYNVILSQACHENSPMNLDSKFTTLLTHPNINRVTWFPQYFVEKLKKMTDINVGRLVDLGIKAYAISEGCDANFISVLNHYLKNWPALEQFMDAKTEFDAHSQHRFINIWDKDTLPDSALEYSALQGASLFRLYHHPFFIATSDQDYIYKNK